MSVHGKKFNNQIYTVSDDINDTDSSHITSIVAVNTVVIMTINIKRTTIYNV